jgi:hypothetical protein
MYEIIHYPYNKKKHYVISVIKLSDTRIAEIITRENYNIVSKVMVRNGYDGDDGDWSHYFNIDFVGYYNPTGYKRISEKQIMNVHNKTLAMIDSIIEQIEKHYTIVNAA